MEMKKQGLPTGFYQFLWARSKAMKLITLILEQRPGENQG